MNFLGRSVQRSLVTSSEHSYHVDRNYQDRAPDRGHFAHEMSWRIIRICAEKRPIFLRQRLWIAPGCVGSGRQERPFGQRDVVTGLAVGRSKDRIKERLTG